MGMFDFYRPIPDLPCPQCLASNLEWQGQDGPCALFVWEQGRSEPADQLVPDECRSPTGSRAEAQLPARFEIYTDCRCPTFLRAVGFTVAGVWTRTELLSPANAIAYPHESEREFQKRLAACGAHPGHAY
jgi:hypothetical protein